MRRSQFITALLMLLLSIILPQGIWAGQAEQLFCEGLYQEVGLGDLEAAIAAYKKVIAKHPDNVAIAAKAQLRIGLCDEKLRRTKEALEAYNKLVSAYPNQPEAEQAQKRLEALGAKKQGEKISQAIRLEHKFTNDEINKYNVRIKYDMEVPAKGLEVSADMTFLLNTETRGENITTRISDCSLKLLVSDEEKVNTQSWLPLEKSGGKGTIKRHEGAQVSGTDLMAGLESYIKKYYGAQINLADIISIAWIRFPEQELQPGQSWSNSLQRFLPEKLITKYTLSGIERYKDKDCAVIAYSSDQRGSAVPIGDSKVMNYHLTEKGTIYWAHQLGVLVECKTDVAVEAQLLPDPSYPVIHLKISLVIERVGPDRRYSSPENTLRELIDALNKKDKERYYACFAKGHQQLFQEFPETQDFLNSYLNMPGKLMIGYTIPSYEIVESGPKIEVKQIVKFEDNGETKEEREYYSFRREGDKWLFDPFLLLSDSFHKFPDNVFRLLIRAINKRTPFLWLQCMASPVRNKLAKMNPMELQDYFNEQWSKFPFRITEHRVGLQMSSNVLPAEYPDGPAMPESVVYVSVDLLKRVSSNKTKIVDRMVFTMVEEHGGLLWVFSLERQKIDLAISSEDIFLTRKDDGSLLIAIKIHNNGNIYVPHVDAKYFCGNPEEGGILIGQGGLDAIQPGISEVKAIPWKVEDGEYEVFVIVDPENEILEMNEDNNRASRVVKVDSKGE